MSSRGSAQMWWIIIGAVIALIVMIVLMVLFTSKTGDLAIGLLDCEGKGGRCVPKTGFDQCSDVCRNAQRTYSSTFTCPVEQCCCLGFGGNKATGESCLASRDCQEGLVCTNGQCAVS